MANNFNLRGTTFPSFQIGAGGPRLFQAITPPDGTDGVDGDIYIVVDGANSGMFQKGNGTWGVVSNPSLGDIAQIDPSVFDFIGSDGTDWIGRTNSSVLTTLGLSSGDTPTFTGVNVSNIS